MVKISACSVEFYMLSGKGEGGDVESRDITTSSRLHYS